MVQEEREEQEQSDSRATASMISKPDGSSSDTGVALGAHVVTQAHHYLLDLLGQLPG